jgi:two-component system chemotaxis sensor kinase CheA
MDELLQDFLAESAEHLEAAGAQIVAFERDPSDARLIADVFRFVHTIKGTCGFLGLARLAQVAHAAESALGRLRDGAAATPDLVSLILAAVDRIKFILGELERLQQEPEGDDADLIADLTAQTPPKAAAASPAPISAPPVDKAPRPAPPADSPPPAAATGGDTSATRAPDGRRREESIRVAVPAIERIMDLVTELVLTRNQLLDSARGRADETTLGSLQRLSALTSDLQDAAMRTRMQPVGRVFSNLPRLVRELAADLGKKITLTTEGAETEIDRQLVELIRDPLTHIVRNCADHGLETPQERHAAGKSETGSIRVSAGHEAEHVVITIEDDGRGLDVAAIRARIVAQGLADEARAAAMSDEEVCRHIFAPGFTTARAVTNVSGRGVGMDVVRTNIESIGGAVSLSSIAGRGARIDLKIPLTVAIAPALIVRIGGQRFVLPQSAVVEAVSVGDGAEHRLESIHGEKVLRLREMVAPVIDLRAFLGLAARDVEDRPLILLIRVAGLNFGLAVDDVVDVQEIVVKPLGSAFSGFEIYAGQTILGDGDVALILDPAGIARKARLTSPDDHRVSSRAAPFRPPAEFVSFVLFRAGPGAIKAMPMSVIARIEELAPEAIEMCDGRPALRHDGRIIPLVRLGAEAAGAGASHVLLLGVGGELMGLIAEEIIDVLDARIDIQIGGEGPGVIGVAELGDHVVELLDAAHFLQAARPDAFARGVARRFRVLLVDDKPFFRDMLSPVLAAAGYVVSTSHSGRAALALFDRGAEFDAVVTDTDMPDMDGYALARALTRERGRTLPILALAAHASETVSRAAEICGMRGAVGKFDRAGLVAALARLLDASMLTNNSLEERVIREAAA